MIQLQTGVTVMRPPRLQQAKHNAQDLSYVPHWIFETFPQETVSLFRITRGGNFCGRWWTPGELVVCKGQPTEGNLVVIAARGIGAPSLGRIVGGRVRGAFGELCSSSRWQVIGKLAAIVDALPPLPASSENQETDVQQALIFQAPYTPAPFETLLPAAVATQESETTEENNGSRQLVLFPNSKAA